LNTDAVLEGSVQRMGDRLRISVNLLRTQDGTSLWSDSFNLTMSDIFSIQDTVAQQVASRLSLKLDTSQQAQLAKQYTSSPLAYEYYQKAIYTFASRLGHPEISLKTIELLQKAIEADPNYALAHAQVAYSYAEMATFVDPTNPKWAELVDAEIARATQIDPDLAETHLAKALIYWSSYGGFQTKSALREVITAQNLNPNVGHAEVATYYAHVGLKELSLRELARASEIDPTSDFVKSNIVNTYWVLGEYDEFLAELRRQFGDKAPEPQDHAWYLVGKRRIEEAQKSVDELVKQKPGADSLSRKAVLLALRGDYAAAEALIPAILEKQSIKDPSYHHVTFDIASIYALEGKSSDAVKWLRKTAESGYPCYPRFEHDTYFDRIRQAPEFIQFLAEMKSDWEGYKSEFDRK
jgi:tetratricopeptide (TPR) repeat protein